MTNDVDITGVECADILDVGCIVERLLEVEELECIDVLDVARCWVCRRKAD